MIDYIREELDAMENRFRAEYFKRIKQAKELGYITQEIYDLLVDMSVETYDELSYANCEFIYFGYLEKSRKGAEFIESITNQDPRWFAANRKLKEIQEIIEKVRSEQKEIEERIKAEKWSSRPKGFETNESAKQSEAV